MPTPASTPAASRTVTLHDAVLRFDPVAGTVDIRRGGRELRGIRASATVPVDGVDRTVSLLGGEPLVVAEMPRLRAVVRTRHEGFTAEWTASVAAGDPLIEISVTLLAEGRAIRPREVRPLEAAWSASALAGETAQARWWVWGSCGWDRPGTRPLTGVAHADDTPTIAYDIAAAYAPSGAAVTLGHVLPSRWMNRIDADGAGVAVRVCVEAAIDAGASLRTDRLLLDLTRPVTEALADIGGRHRGRRTADESHEHWGWNTWDFFTDKVTERDVDQALVAIKAKPWLASKLRYVIVDDFWQDTTGDWNPGARFGSIERAATSIAAAGFVPGIWTAPFFADRHSQVLRDHPDWVLRTTDDKEYTHCMGCDPPWGDRCYLDPTHPGVREHIFQLYRKLHRWGFRYFKTDFLANAISWAYPGESEKWNGKVKVHDPSLGLVRGHRACMEAIRAAIGPESWWLGCGTHFATGAGLMDSTRMSGDIRVYWANLLICARSAAFNSFMHGNGFILDPDFAVFRGRDTVLPGGLELAPLGTKPYVRGQGDGGPTFSLAEAQLWASVIIMCGGAVTLSDRMDGLNEAGLGIVRTLLEHGGGAAALPLDLFEPMPRIWRKRRAGETWLMLANWDDEGVRRIAVPDDAGVAEGAELVEVWTGERTRFRRGMAVEIPAHGHRLWRAVG